ncbi:hypothetical protein CP532_1178 [Ophiocordyceps camponoti-leonardi (nom. inval.)]|nr:hypothetical protein CP532_1178 [Ophiocordyceps camponoti-leonardi (nom. inval.)]
MADKATFHTSQQSQRQAAILGRFLPEGYSADPDVSLTTEPVEEPVDDSVRTSRQPSPSNFQPTMADSTPAINETSHNGDPSLPEPHFLISLHLACNLPMSCHTRSNVSLEDLGANTCNVVHVNDASVVHWSLGTSSTSSTSDDRVDMLRRPLLGRHRSSRRFLRNGDASTLKTFFTLLKAFIGTGIMFLPKAFLNGGILFSSLTLVVVSLINCLCFRLLLECRRKHGNSPVVNAVQVLYSLAVLGGEPVQLFPAVRIIETSLFGERATGKRSVTIKWKKNAIRSAVIGICTIISMVGATDLDKFVALIGSFACVPLVYIYPAYLHYKGVASKSWTKGLDLVLMLLGIIAMLYTTVVTLGQWIDIEL